MIKKVIKNELSFANTDPDLKMGKYENTEANTDPETAVKFQVDPTGLYEVGFGVLDTRYTRVWTADDIKLKEA